MKARVSCRRCRYVRALLVLRFLIALTLHISHVLPGTLERDSLSLAMLLLISVQRRELKGRLGSAACSGAAWESGPQPWQVCADSSDGRK